MEDKRTFQQLLQASIKSKDTEEWLDVHFTRPAGLLFALLWRRLGVHPNVVTLIGIVFGVAGAIMFYFTDPLLNITGIVLLVMANVCDCTDGQLARLTGRKTLLGRVLDGFSGDIIFFAIYLVLVLRMWDERIPFTGIHWGWWGFALAFIAGVLSHSPQSSLSDYYRQIHLFFLKGREGSELDSYAKERRLYDMTPKGALFKRLVYYNYANYCRSQERRTPCFQSFYSSLLRRYGDNIPRDLSDEFLRRSRPLMPFTNILTFNTRAIIIYITVLLDCPWIYMMIELSVMNILYFYMHHRHELLCQSLMLKI